MTFWDVLIGIRFHRRRRLGQRMGVRIPGVQDQLLPILLASVNALPLLFSLHTKLRQLGQGGVVVVHQTEGHSGPAFLIQKLEVTEGSHKTVPVLGLDLLVGQLVQGSDVRLSPTLLEIVRDSHVILHAVFLFLQPTLSHCLLELPVKEVHCARALEKVGINRQPQSGPEHVRQAVRPAAVRQGRGVLRQKSLQLLGSHALPTAGNQAQCIADQTGKGLEVILHPAQDLLKKSGDIGRKFVYALRQLLEEPKNPQLLKGHHDVERDFSLHFDQKGIASLRRGKVFAHFF